MGNSLEEKPDGKQVAWRRLRGSLAEGLKGGRFFFGRLWRGKPEGVLRRRGFNRKRRGIEESLAGSQPTFCLKGAFWV